MGDEIMLVRFDVAIWQRDVSYGLPIVGQVFAVDGPTAVAALMWAFRISWAAHVTASYAGGAIVYRADDVWGSGS